MTRRILYAPGLLAALTALIDVASGPHRSSAGRAGGAACGPEARAAFDALTDWLLTLRFESDPARPAGTAEGGRGSGPDSGSWQQPGISGPVTLPALAIPVHFEVGLRDVVMRDSGDVSAVEWAALRECLIAVDPDAECPILEHQGGLWCRVNGEGATDLALSGGESGGDWVQREPHPLAIADGVVLRADFRHNAARRQWLRWTTLTQMAWRDHVVNRARAAAGQAPIEGWFFWRPGVESMGLFDVHGGVMQAVSPGDLVLADDVSPATRQLLRFAAIEGSYSERGQQEDPTGPQKAAVRSQPGLMTALDDHFLRSESRHDPLQALMRWPANVAAWRRRLGGAFDVADRPGLLGSWPADGGFTETAPTSGEVKAGHLRASSALVTRLVAQIRAAGLRAKWVGERDPSRRCASVARRLLQG